MFLVGSLPELDLLNYFTGIVYSVVCRNTHKKVRLVMNALVSNKLMKINEKFKYNFEVLCVRPSIVGQLVL